MNSAAVNATELLAHSRAVLNLVGKEENLVKWLEHPASSILHHDGQCCEKARAWFLAYARSREIGIVSQYSTKAPNWFSERFVWGPSKWPISWCQLVKEKVLDCGVFAALAREIFQAQGLKAHPAQALVTYNDVCTGHWREYWTEDEPSSRMAFPWIGNQIVYHELVALELPGGYARFYDSTWGTWYAPGARLGWGALLALRTECPRLLQWGGKTFSCGEWVDL